MGQYARPESLGEACALLCTAQPWRIVAGGTDIYPALGEAANRASLLDISALPGLRGVTRDEAGWRIGALTTWTDVLRAPLPPAFDGLKLAAREVGSVQIQNVATLAGNICNASPAADGIVALMALDAQVEIAGPSSRRLVALDAFVLGVRRVDLGPGEIVTAILVPDSGARSVSHFLKLGARRYLVISIAMAAVNIRFDDDARVASDAIVVGACSPVARRLRELEARLIGASGDELPALVRDD
ncbi:MAG TPA: FAD binding domain-containing protein, partial [Saliniramus sp.]|nr:FAD binding domain-containing protein [Saliniramus sp.]